MKWYKIKRVTTGKRMYGDDIVTTIYRVNLLGHKKILHRYEIKKIPVWELSLDADIWNTRYTGCIYNKNVGFQNFFHKII